MFFLYFGSLLDELTSLELQLRCLTVISWGALLMALATRINFAWISFKTTTTTTITTKAATAKRKMFCGIALVVRTVGIVGDRRASPRRLGLAALKTRTRHIRIHNGSSSRISTWNCLACCCCCCCRGFCLMSFLTHDDV